jgi:hypothetical protein
MLSCPPIERRALVLVLRVEVDTEETEAFRTAAEVIRTFGHDPVPANVSFDIPRLLPHA